MKLKLLLLFMFAIHSHVYASKVRITGNVLCNEDCKNIENGKITLEILDSGTSEKYSAKISKRGKYKIKYPSKYRYGKITIASSSHKTFNKYVNLSGKNVKKDYTIKALYEHRGINQKSNRNNFPDNRKKTTAYNSKQEVKKTANKGEELYNPYFWGDNELIQDNQRSSNKSIDKENSNTKSVDIIEHTKKMRSKYGGSEHSDRMLASEKEQADYSRKLNRKLTNYSLQREEKFNKERNIKSQSESQKNKLKTNKPSKNDKVQANKTNLKSRSKLNSKNKDKEPDPWNMSDDLIFYNLIVHQEQSWHGCSSVNKCYQIIGDEYYKTPNEIKNIAFRGIVNNWKTP